MARINNDMNPLKKAIFKEVRNTYPEGDIHNLTDNGMNSLFFQQPDSLRLTLMGFATIRKVFTAYSFELPTDVKSKHLRNLSKFEYPYFLTRKRLILFSEMDASVIKLHGSVTGFLESFDF
jgi:hypothetical protein